MTEATNDDQIHALQCMVDELQSSCREASRSSSLKTDFLASMSHEIRIPMNSVIGISQLLLQTSLDNEQRELALTLSESAEALLCTINDILDFSKIEAGKFDICHSEFDVVSLVEGCVDIFARQAEQKGISIFSFIHPDVPRRVTGDSRYVRRILLNLISNAVKFTSNGGIGVCAELTDTAEDRVNVRFTVKDTGIGISESKTEQLFQPYHQADETIGSKYGGTGLGLSICKQLCELMQGTIGLSSLLNQGSDFWFELPFLPVDDSSNLFSTQSTVLKRKNMLLVNYGRYAVGALMSYARAWKMGLHVVTSIPEAIEAVRNANYDIVAINAETIDQTLASFAEATANASSRNKVKLLLVSSKQSRSLTQRAMSIGFAAHLSFPLRQSRLLDCLLQLTETKEEAKIDAPVVKPNEPRLKFAGAPILIVEDNVVNQKVLMLQLKQLGYDAIAVGSGEEAVEAVRTNRVSLVLMDCEMPGMDGFTASELIRQHELESGLHIPIIAVTGHVVEQAQSRCLKAGMDDFMTKPVRPPSLQSVIERWLPLAAATTNSAVAADTSSRASNKAAAIDLQKVHAMCSSDDETRELLQLFLCSSRTLVAELESATQTYDVVAVKNACQQLRGCCNSVGATQISKLVIGIEMASDEESWHAARAFLRQLRKAHTEVQDFVTRFWRTIR